MRAPACSTSVVGTVVLFLLDAAHCLTAHEFVIDPMFTYIVPSFMMTKFLVECPGIPGNPDTIVSGAPVGARSPDLSG